MKYFLGRTELFVRETQDEVTVMTKARPADQPITHNGVEFYTIPQAAKATGYHRQSIYQAVWDEEIETYDLGGLAILVKKADVERIFMRTAA